MWGHVGVVLWGCWRRDVVGGGGVLPPLALAVGVSDDPVRPGDRSGAPSYARLVEMVAELVAANSELEGVNAGQAARIAELEARLNADSSNSSTPPSAEGLRNKPAAARWPAG